MMRIRELLILSIAFSWLSFAQAPGKGAAKGGGRAAPAVPGYEVGTDRRVTFRLRAPEAATVTVSGDFATGAQTSMSSLRRQTRDDLVLVAAAVADIFREQELRR